MPPRLVVVGVPNDKRTMALLSAVERARAEATCVPWSVAMQSPQAVGDAGRAGDYLRVESPGADAATWRALASAGGEERVFEAGEWRPGRGWFRGLEAFLAALEPHVAHLRPTHPGDHVLAMMDKRACHERLARAGVPVPEMLPTPANADELRLTMRALGRAAVYVKPRWGSSGAGVLAYRYAAGRELLVTTARLLGGRMFNHKRLYRYESRSDIDVLLNAVLTDGAFVQRWIPKAGTAGGPLDLRVLVIRGTAAQAVGRVGRGTITNLHLDASRVSVEAALASFGSSAWPHVQSLAEQAAACFAGHHSVGVDVMVDTRGKPFVIECNAWGDYLPRLLVDGLDSYDLYVRGLFARSEPALEAVS